MTTICLYQEIYHVIIGEMTELIGRGPDQPTTFTSDMHRGYVVADGWDETHFTRGATISVSLNGPTLKLLTFRSTIYDRVAYWIDA